jgi:SAM-dependent methyltransferase
MLYPHDHFYPRFERFLREITNRQLVLDLGTYRPLRKELAAHRSLFRNRYFAMDRSYEPGAPGPDVVGDILRLPFESHSADAIICKEVLEHVRDPGQAVSEMHRVLKAGGALLGTVPFLHPYHGKKGHLPDFWRFTEEGVAELFSGFSSVEIERAGGAMFVLRAFSPARPRAIVFSPMLAPLVNALDRFSMRWGASHLFLVLARK